MRLIDMLGLRNVLQALGQWRDGMKVPEAREVLWRWNEVVDQRTVVEELVRSELSKSFLLYNVKYHPLYNSVEKLWRYCKAPLRQNRLNSISRVRL
jgi:hypothetical protein